MFSNDDPFWGTFWGQLSIELIGGLISGLSFLFILLFFFRPHLKLSPFIGVKRHNGNGEVYFFKFVNLSFFSAHDINIELFSIRKIPMGGGKFNPHFEKLNLLLSQISHVPNRPFAWAKTKDNVHCVVIRCQVDLRNILIEETNAILLKVSLKHGLTGLTKVFEQEYANVEDIKRGKFKPGTKFEMM